MKSFEIEEYFILCDIEKLDGLGVFLFSFCGCFFIVIGIGILSIIFIVASLPLSTSIFGVASIFAVAESAP